MIIQEGIIYVNSLGEDLLELSARTRISDGIVNAGANINQKYCEGAIIPKQPWQSATEDTLSKIIANGNNISYGNWIDIIPIPKNLLHPFEPLQQSSENGRSDDEINSLIYQKDEFRNAIPNIVEYLESINTKNKCHANGVGIRANPPGCLTVTQGKDRSCYIGLHLDSWYRYPLNDRHLSPNRVCVNLGFQDRYLIFINLTLTQISEMIASKSQHTKTQPRHEFDLLGPFAELNSEYPVVSIRIKPGEAYIAPTENFFHDGSTLGNDCADVQLTILGEFFTG